MPITVSLSHAGSYRVAQLPSLRITGQSIHKLRKKPSVTISETMDRTTLRWSMLLALRMRYLRNTHSDLCRDNAALAAIVNIIAVG